MEGRGQGLPGDRIPASKETRTCWTPLLTASMSVTISTITTPLFNHDAFLFGLCYGGVRGL